jgi:hypothetical protein
MELGRKVFYKADANRDGVITPRELRDSGVAVKMGLLANGKTEKDIIADADRNKDGVLSRYEGEQLFTSAASGSAVAAIAASLMTEDIASFPYAQEAAKAEKEKPTKQEPPVSKQDGRDESNVATATTQAESPAHTESPEKPKSAATEAARALYAKLQEASFHEAAEPKEVLV